MKARLINVDGHTMECCSLWKKPVIEGKEYVEF